MLFLERKQQILDILKERQSATVAQLSRALYVSEPTIRRDLSQMEAEGMLLRVHGGAALLESINQDAPLLVRSSKSREKKLYIANLALQFVKDSTTMFLDSSSTVTVFAAKLDRFQNLSIITNGIATMQLLNESAHSKVYICGGIVKNQSSVIGPFAQKMISDINVDIFFFSCSGLSIDCGLTEPSEDSAAIKRLMFKNAKRKILLCDSTKLDTDFFCRVCEVSELDAIVTDKAPSEDFIKKAGIPIYY